MLHCIFDPEQFLKRLCDGDKICSAFADKAVRLWLLCPSFQRGAQEEIPCGHTLLDGSGGHFQATIWHRGEGNSEGYF